MLIRTYTGKELDPLDLKPSDINPTDIAWSLSMQCRFNGHVPEFYSVAEHCLLVGSLVSEEHRPWALLHDAAEAYLGDVIAPVKSLIPALSH